MQKNELGNGVKIFGLQSFKRIPEFLSMADAIVIPQRRSYSTVGQVPDKIFDAMAMVKPIIVTNVSDLPEILNGCGWIVEVGNPEQLSRMVQYVMDNPEEAKKVRLKARSLSENRNYRHISLKTHRNN